MWEIVICESDENFAALLTEKVKAFYNAREFEIATRIYPDGQSFIDALDQLEQSMDLIFLNTRLSDMSGFAAASLFSVWIALKTS